MKLTRWLRRIWHDIYYGLVPKRGLNFAMKCKEVTAKIDLRDCGHGKERFRYWLHLSLCQPCKNYLQMSTALRKALKSQTEEAATKTDIEKINRELLHKHSGDGST